MTSTRCWPAVALALGALLAARAGRAHSFELTRVEATFDGAGGYAVELTADFDALALGLPEDSPADQVVAHLESLPEGEARAREQALAELLRRRLRIRFDGEMALPESVGFPRRGERVQPGDVPTFFGPVARLSGRVPPAARSFTWKASAAFAPVHLSVRAGDGSELATQALERGVESAPIDLTALRPPAWWRTVVIYLRLGFVHILPRGLDHILFVLGLFLLAARWRPLLWQVSAFTLAHTVTLALATFGVVALPSSIVEPLIAASIAYVALENVFTDRLFAWRPALVFLFGLLHGLGFAGVLAELGLPRGRTMSALVAFNAGVELGQLTVLAIAFAALGPWRNRPWYRRRVVVPGSLAIAALGCWWALERALGP